MGMHEWKPQWDEVRRVLVAYGASGKWSRGAALPPRFEVDRPATEAKVAAVESELGQPIPASFRRVLRGFSARVCIEWALPTDKRPHGVFRPIWSGECRWDLNSLVALQKTHRKWIDVCFTGRQPTDWEKPPRLIEYDLVWHNKFAVLEVGNSDMIGISVADSVSQPVTYLSHEDGEFHGYRLGSDFEDYVNRLTKLAFVGAEDWQMTPFLSDAIEGLQTESDNAREWRRMLGVETGAQ